LLGLSVIAAVPISEVYTGPEMLENLHASSPPPAAPSGRKRQKA
jgi:hypothetical protein